MFFLLFSVVFLGSLSARAGDHDLHGVEAAKMAGILDSAGIHALWDVTIGFSSAQNLQCSGLNFVDGCEATPADFLPAAKSLPIRPGDTDEFWSLLKKAGFRDQPGQGEDSGKVVISASRIDCTLNTDESQDVCTLK